MHRKQYLSKQRLHWINLWLHLCKKNAILTAEKGFFFFPKHSFEFIELQYTVQYFIKETKLLVDSKVRCLNESREHLPEPYDVQ